MTEPSESMTHPSGSSTPPPPAPPSARSFFERLWAAMKLEPSVYEEVEHDPTALGQAAAVVALAAVAGAIGALGAAGPQALLGGIVMAFVSWVLWTALVWLIGVKLLDHSSDFEELLRTLGFVAAPQIFYLLAIVPWHFFQALVALAVLVMTVIAFVRAIRTALDVDTLRAALIAAAGVGIQVILGLAFGVAFLTP